MARVFLSHCSLDKEIVRRIADDLAHLGHRPWLDEWEIKVGECIITRVEQGLEDADYVVLILSPNAVASGWVDREWKQKYWQEIAKNTVMLLPALVKECDIPPLLRSRKYADFRQNYALGLVQLTSAIAPIIESVEPEPVEPIPDTSKITDLIKQVYGRRKPLSEMIAEALTIAQEAGDKRFAKWCRLELTGWDEESGRLIRTISHIAKSASSWPSKARLILCTWNGVITLPLPWSTCVRTLNSFEHFGCGLPILCPGLKAGTCRLIPAKASRPSKSPDSPFFQKPRIRTGLLSHMLVETRFSACRTG